MSTLGAELRASHRELVHRWYQRWRNTSHPDRHVGEAALKDSLPQQLELIGEQLAQLGDAERADEMWKITERLRPEARVDQRVPIEEIVQEYALVTDVVREWIEEKRIEVPFAEYSYFYQALYELAAESVRRYTEYQSERIRRDRAHYLAAIMHQLRTPIATLSMQLDLLERQGRSADDAAMARLRRNVQRIQQLVDRVLRLERFESWEVPVRPEVVAPAKLVDSVIHDHGPEAARKGVRLTTTVDPGLEMTIDPALSIDALGNLVHNAVKYCDDGEVSIHVEARDGEVAFHVHDSGPGIPVDRQELLLKQSQPGSSGGIGIGLQIAQHAAQAQGGRIEFRSQPGQGSIFTLHLPRIVTRRAPHVDSTRDTEDAYPVH